MTMESALYSTLLDAAGFLVVAITLFLPVPYLAWIALKTAVNWRKYEQTGYILETPASPRPSELPAPEPVVLLLPPEPSKRAA
jgi:hypothetical protein